MTSPAYRAGLDAGDDLREIDGRRVTSAEEVQVALSRKRPGDTVSVTFVNRTGVPQIRSVTLAENPDLELLPIEASGGTVTKAHVAFRQNWLGQ
jgi:S1-C subfamily serine protease